MFLCFYVSMFMHQKSDEQLVEEYLKGDEESFDFLIRKYLKPVYGFVYQYAGNVSDAEDIAQETFVRVWKNIKKFDINKKFKTWVFTIAKNAAVDFLRKKKPMLFTELETEDGGNIIDVIPDPAHLPSEIFDRDDLACMLEKAIDKIPLKYREVMILYYKEQLNFREIAEVSGEPLDTIKSRHRRGIIRLRDIIGAQK